MGFLKKKERQNSDASEASARPKTATSPQQPVPEFTFMRTTTNTQEVITPPAFPGDGTTEEVRGRFARLGFKSRLRSHSDSDGKDATPKSPPTSPPAKLDVERVRPSAARRLSHRLGLKRELSSANIPESLPAIPTSADAEHTEGEWEKRATILARSNEISRSQSRHESPSRCESGMNKGIGHAMGLGIKSSEVIGSKEGIVGNPKVDDNIQEAIRLHEEGSLEQATRMFGRLADPGGQNNALSQVLYGLALRHGWGCEADPERAVQFLSAAASNAASIEEAALTAGSMKGGSAKGELVLAIYELANSYRNGWGVKKDPVAAKQYLEVAANLGDTDAMNEVAWCYLQGFGCKKEKMQAAKYYRLAEKGGNKILGNSWIWKPKYDACGVEGLKLEGK